METINIYKIELNSNKTAIIVNDRWYIYLDGAFEIYDNDSAEDIPQVLFELRDIVKVLTRGA